MSPQDRERIIGILCNEAAEWALVENAMGVEPDARTRASLIIHEALALIRWQADRLEKLERLLPTGFEPDCDLPVRFELWFTWGWSHYERGAEQSIHTST